MEGKFKSASLILQRLTPRACDMRVGWHHDLIILYDLVQRGLHLLVEGGEDYLLCLCIEVLQRGSFSRVNFNFPGEEFLGVRKARRD